MDSFKCMQCGSCCRNLNIDIGGGVTVGLFLLPSELNIFPSDSMKPLWRSNFKTVFAWQMTSDTCPFLQDNTCLRYQSRPASCKGYPVQVLMKSHEASIDVKCPSARTLPHGLPAITVFNAEIMCSADLIAKYLMNMSRQAKVLHIFDLKTSSWKLFDMRRIKAMREADARRVSRYV